MRILITILFVACMAVATAQTEGLDVPKSVTRTGKFELPMKISGFTPVPGMTEESFAATAKTFTDNLNTKNLTLDNSTTLLQWEGEWTYNCGMATGCERVKGVIAFTLTLLPGKDGFVYDFTNFEHRPDASVAKPLKFGTISQAVLSPYDSGDPETTMWVLFVWDDIKASINKSAAATLKSVNAHMAAAGK